MFGFLFGAACIGGLIALTTNRHHRHWHGRGGYGCRGGFSRGFRRGRYFLNGIFERLDTTPGQEKAILSALDELRDRVGSFRERMQSSRADVAAALRDDEFQPERVREVINRHAQELTELGDASTDAVGRIHEALDPEQRRRLARWIESGPRFSFG